MTVPSLDQLAADPGRVQAIPLDAAEKLLAQVHVVQGALLTRLLAARAQADSQPEASVEGLRLLTVEEVASLLNFTPAYLYDLIRRGEFPALRQGKYLRVPVRALGEWIKKHLDEPISIVYSPYKRRSRGRQNTPTNPAAARTDSIGLGATVGRLPQHRRAVGAGRGANPRGDGPADPAPGRDES